MREILEISGKHTGRTEKSEGKGMRMTRKERETLIERLTKEMKAAAKMLDFEHAAYLRDRIAEINKQQ